MLIKNKPVYYCEYCKKHGLSKYAMKEHELCCTLNPNRHCKVCGRTERISQAIIERAVEIYNNNGEDLFNFYSSCPMCSFSILRRAKLLGCENILVGFDLEEAVKKYWEDNDNRSPY